MRPATFGAIDTQHPLSNGLRAGVVGMRINLDEMGSTRGGAVSTCY